MSAREQLKQQVAAAAIREIVPQLSASTIIGIGSGSTVNCFIEHLCAHRASFDGAIAASKESAAQLAACKIAVYDLNTVVEIPIYIDSCDEIDAQLQMLKGGGGALTREKIIAAASREFLCIADDSKYVQKLGTFAIAVEVLPIARSLVAREIVTLGGMPVWRKSFITDNGNVILDVRGLNLDNAVEMERRLNHLSGVVCNGVFADRPADRLLLASAQGVQAVRREPKSG